MTAGRPLVLTPLDWAQRIVAGADVLEFAGTERETAWCIAAGVRRSANKAVPARVRVAQWVATQPEPVTSFDVAEALDMTPTDAANALRQAEVRGDLAMAGTVKSGHARRILWRAP